MVEIRQSAWRPAPSRPALAYILKDARYLAKHTDVSFTGIQFIKVDEVSAELAIASRMALARISSGRNAAFALALAKSSRLFSISSRQLQSRSASANRPLHARNGGVPTGKLAISGSSRQGRAAGIVGSSVGKETGRRFTGGPYTRNDLYWAR